MQIKLRVIGGKSAGHEIAVSGPKFSIGHGAGCQLRPRGDTVAERHCDLLLEPGLVTLVDHGSPAGTYINGQRVQGSQELKPGDRLKVGPLELEMVLVASVAAQKKPKVSSVEEAAARMATNQRDEVDVSSWLDDGDAPAVPSRYAAQLSDAEKAALGVGPEAENAPTEEPKPARSPTKPAPATPGSEETSQAAEQVLNKYFKRR